MMRKGRKSSDMVVGLVVLALRDSKHCEAFSSCNFILLRVHMVYELYQNFKWNLLFTIYC